MRNYLMKVLILIASVFVGFFCIANAKNEYEEYETSDLFFKRAITMYRSIVCNQDMIAVQTL